MTVCVKYSLIISPQQIPVLKGHDGSVPGFMSSLTTISKKSNQQHLLGNSPEEQALVRQWLEYAVTSVNHVDTPHVLKQVLRVLQNAHSDYVTQYCDLQCLRCLICMCSLSSRISIAHWLGGHILLAMRSPLLILCCTIFCFKLWWVPKILNTTIICEKNIGLQERKCWYCRFAYLFLCSISSHQLFLPIVTEQPYTTRKRTTHALIKMVQ